MTKTENFNLNQWEASDPICRADFNADNAAIDAALTGCARVACGTYTGTGTYGTANPCTLAFGFTPKVVFVFQTPTYFGPSYWTSNIPYFSTYNQVFYYGATTFHAASGDGTGSVTYALENNTLTWYGTKTAGIQMNSSGTKYGYVAIG